MNHLLTAFVIMLFVFAMPVWFVKGDYAYYWANDFMRAFRSSLLPIMAGMLTDSKELKDAFYAYAILCIIDVIRIDNNYRTNNLLYNELAFCGQIIILFFVFYEIYKWHYS